MNKKCISLEGSMQNGAVQYPGLDIMKFICAVLIMISHLGPFESFSRTLNYWAVNLSFRFAVPFFFLCSGYFFRGNVFWGKRLTDWLKRNMMLYSLWTAVYIAFALPYTITPDTVVEFLLRGGAGAFHLWFFPSLMISMVFVYILLDRCNPKIALFSAAVLYGIGLFGDSYGNLLPFFPAIKMVVTWYNNLFGGTRNGILFPSIFLYMGMFLAENKKSFLLQFSRGYTLAALFVFYCLWVLEVVFITKMGLAWDLNLTIFIVPTAFFLFLFFSGLDWPDKMTAVKFRKMSTMIYCLHILIKNLWDQYFLCRFTLNSLERCAAIVLCTLLVSYLLLCLSEHFSFLKKLY